MKTIPFGINGVALSFLVLTEAYHTAHMPMISHIFFDIGTIIFIISLLQWAINIKGIWRLLHTPEEGAMLTTSGMGIMVYSSLKYHFFSGSLAWCYALFLDRIFAIFTLCGSIFLFSTKVFFFKEYLS